MRRHVACGEGWRLSKRQSHIATCPELDATDHTRATTLLALYPSVHTALPACFTPQSC